MPSSIRWEIRWSAKLLTRWELRNSLNGLKQTAQKALIKLELQVIKCIAMLFAYFHSSFLFLLTPDSRFGTILVPIHSNNVVNFDYSIIKIQFRYYMSRFQPTNGTMNPAQKNQCNKLFFTAISIAANLRYFQFHLEEEKKITRILHSIRSSLGRSINVNSLSSH